MAVEAVSAAVRRLREKDRGAEISALTDRLNDRVPAENLTWILPDVPAFYPSALGIMRASSGGLNVNDALISLACRERDITVIASFDSDFDRVD